MEKLLLLDRDGVINQDSDAFVKNADEFLPLAGAIDALARLYKAGWTLAIATNQSGLARGKFSQEDLDAMHAKLLTLLHQAGGDLHHLAWCPHGPDDGCDCRKPKPGLLHQIAVSLNVELDQAIMVGDALRDLQAGDAAGCRRKVLVRTGKGEKTLKETPPEVLRDLGIEVYPDLASLAEDLLSSY